MHKVCYTAYISVKHQIIESITTCYYKRSKKLAEIYVKENNIKDASITVEETTDKFMENEEDD